MEKIKLENSNKLQVWGRFVNYQDYLGFDNVASGFEVRFYGTSISASMATIARPRINKAYPMFSVLSVMIDGEDPLKRRVDVTNEEFCEITLAKDLPLGYHTAKVLKTDDPLISMLLIKEVFTDGKFEELEVKNEIIIEVYGDSILSGGDNLIGDGESLDVVPGTGNGIATYVGYTALHFGMRFNVLSRCGLCLYGASPYDTEIVVEKIYDKVSPLILEKWEMLTNKSIISVIGLGTNDENGANFTIKDFANSYANFIRNLVKYYGENTPFILTYGYMNKNDNVELAIKEVVNELSNEGLKVYSLKLPKAKRGHPSVEEHQAGAKLLIDLLNDILAK